LLIMLKKEAFQRFYLLGKIKDRLQFLISHSF
jgi:hypothetical protein